jgi:hypothetical protein
MDLGFGTLGEGPAELRLNFYALHRDGAHAAARIYRGGRYAVTDERGTRPRTAGGCSRGRIYW